MKLIMENWRGFVERSPYEELLVETFRQYEKGQLEEDLFRSIVTGLGLAVGTMFLFLQAERSGQLEQAKAEMRQNLAELDSDETKLEELESQIKNPNAWQFSDDADPKSPERFPAVEIDGEWHTAMPADWSIALKVAQDKASGVVDIPGMASGELPSPQEIYDVLKGGDDSGLSPDLANFTTDLQGEMELITQLGTDFQGVGGQVSPDHEMITTAVAVNPEYFEANPDYVTLAGVTAQDLYIQYYFGKYLGADEAVNFGVELGGQK